MEASEVQAGGGDRARDGVARDGIVLRGRQQRLAGCDGWPGGSGGATPRTVPAEGVGGIISVGASSSSIAGARSRSHVSAMAELYAGETA